MTRLRDRIFKRAVFFCASFLVCAEIALAQEPAQKPKEDPAASSQEKRREPLNAAQIELLETKYRFETNGDSRKEVHALVKINSELGVRQFARLNFDYNRGFQSVEIPLAHITHANGGTSDILPSTISDAPNPAVEQFPAYQDVRVKSVRILGLQPGDSLEYRVITKTTKSPLAPDFWLAHTFDRTGVASSQSLTLRLPSGRGYVHSDAKIPLVQTTGPEGDITYQWTWKQPPTEASQEQAPDEPDVSASTFATEVEWQSRLAQDFYAHSSPTRAVKAKARELINGGKTTFEHVKSIYAFVSKDIATVDLPIGATDYSFRPLDEVLDSRAASPEDKAALFTAMVLASEEFSPQACFTFREQPKPPFYALPTQIDHTLLAVTGGMNGKTVWLDPALEVAPFGAVSATYRGKSVLCLARSDSDPSGLWEQVPANPPFPSRQQVIVQSSIDSAGLLHAKVKYALRGDNELLLRVTFHRTPKEKQQEIAQYLALSDGFRGKVTSVKASDPYATDVPFEVEYELRQEKFVDWSKKPVRIPVLLPLPGLPEPPKKSASDAKIELGPPLAIELSGTLRLPPGTTAQAPPGTSVKRDYATFSSVYSAKENLLRFSRHLNFVSQEISGTRAVDLSAFVHAVQSDQSQLFVLENPDSVPPPKPK
jgi:hypothetical protein